MIIEAKKNPNGYNIIQIIDVIKMLSHSQGFYQRLLDRILDLKENDPEKFNEYKDLLESLNLRDEIDVINHFEGMPTFTVKSL